MQWRSDDAGAASGLAFIVAGTLFLAALGVLIATAQNKVPPETDEHILSYRSEAQAILALLTQSPGLRFNGDQWDVTNGTWTPGQNNSIRPSLVDAPGRLDKNRVETWNETCSQGCVSYANATRSFGLDAAGLAFHLVVVGDCITELGWSPQIGPEPPQGYANLDISGAQGKALYNNKPCDVRVLVFPA